MMAFVVGGAASGKSAYAEQLACQLGEQRVYLAAMRPFGEEGAARVRRHRALRAGKGFTTVECYDDFCAALADERLDGATVLLECLGNVVANELFRADDAEGDATFLHGASQVISQVGAHSVRPPVMSQACAHMVDALEALSLRCEHLVVVGNEVAADGVLYPLETRAYQQLLGDVSRAVAERSDLVVEVVAGMPFVVRRSDACPPLPAGMLGVH